ncbi:hypothetical protein Taro_051400 [Colocasia esculenta]|uniref:Scarecrow-like protein 6 n=1 Tax=Colocasia esculenta TaxID=4460 RepID=A0A843XGR8_COLES|nr:hypothetical protein [Colocasia esculenta]
MRGAPFSLQGKGDVPVEVAAATGALWKSTATSSSGSGGSSGGGIGKKGGVEPRSVLDHRRSPSPPTSTSTLCSSQGGGGGGSTDSAGVAAVSDNPLHKWPPSQDTPSSASAEAAVGGGGGNGEGRREDWTAELQPIPAGLEIGLLGSDKCGLGMEDWESVMLAEPGGGGGTSPGHDQSFLKWIMGEVEDPTSAGGLRQQCHHQVLPQVAMEFEGGGGALGGPPGLVDPVFGFEHLGGMGVGLSGSLVAPPPSSSSSSSSPVASLGGFSVLNSNNGSTNIDSRILPISPGSGHLQALKGPIFGNNSNPNPFFSPPAGNTLQLPLSMPPGMLFQEPSVEEKPHLFGPNLFLSPQQAHPPPPNPAFFLPYAQPDQQQHHPLLPPRPKRLQYSMADPSCQVPPGVPFSDPVKDPFLRRLQQQQHPQGAESLHPLPYHNLPQVPMKPKVASDEAAAATAAHQQQQQQQQVLVDQLLKAAEMVEARNFVNARGILARLNHQLSPIGKPLVRSAYYCKEALQCIITHSSNSVLPSTFPPLLRNPSSAALSTPLDVVLKLSAYKAFSEVSPIVQFANFTCTQALLEELNGCGHIHIIDFDIGVGGQWSSFMQELAQRRCSATAATPVLKITAFASLYSNHPLELGLTRENLSQFASDLNIPFEINILSIDNFEPANLLNVVRSDEAIAVNLPVGLAYPSIAALLRLVKQLAPKIVVSVDHGCDRSEATFSRYFLHSLQSAAFLLDSIDAAGTSLDVTNKIERYLLQPRIENAFLVRHRAADKALPWRTLFNSSGFVSVPFSNFTETQAECLLKRFQVRGFHVEKRQQSLLLCWQQGELASVSAWRC